MKSLGALSLLYRLDDPAHLLRARAEHEDVFQRHARIVCLEQQAAAMDGCIDGDFLIGKGVDGDSEIHPRITRIDIFEEVFGTAQFREEIREIEGP